MTKPNLILHKKLQECEAKLNEILETPYQEFYSDDQVQDIQKSLGFLKNFLSAEITSSPPIPHQLQQIANRISDLETNFRNWNDFRATTAMHNCIERSSTCSCTESCLNDDGEASPPQVQENVVEDEKAPPEKEGIKVEEWREDLKKEEKRGGRIFGTMAGGMLIGMALMGFVMVKFCACFPCAETSTPMCLPPT